MYDEAVNDAEVCVILKEDWWKGYYRKGLAQLKLNLLVIWNKILLTNFQIK